MKVAFRFLATGVLNTLPSYAVFCALVYFGTHYMPACAIGYAVAMCNSYVINKGWTFSDKRAASAKNFSSFVLVNLVSLAVNLAFLGAFVELGLTPYLAQAFAIAFSLAVNFLGCRFFVFKGAK